MAKSRHYFIRKAHRYLGVVLGIQFLFWTMGGLYFSWTDLDEIHGDFHRKPVPQLSGAIHWISPDSVFKNLPHKADSIQSLQMTTILQKPFYLISYNTGGRSKRILADAQTGKVRGVI